MIILAIETSCDETAVAVVKAAGSVRAPKFEILSNAVSSQIAIHREYGGVVPNLAKREHEKNLPIVLRKGLEKSKIQNPESGIDLMCVTTGPGLEPALWAGISFAKELRKKWGTPLSGVNHLDGHLYSFLLARKTANKKYDSSSLHRNDTHTLFPAIALIVSGGHTILVYMESLTQYKKIGETRDDAAGEAFDKVARMMGLSYPGGVEIEQLAKNGAKNMIVFPRPMMHINNFDVSFSGLKTSVLYYLRNNPLAKKEDVAASFQAAVVDVLVAKTTRAADKYGAQSIFLSGGVASNKSLRDAMRAAAHREGARCLIADMKFNTDNAVMIAVAGYINMLRKKRYALRANGNLNM